MSWMWYCEECKKRGKLEEPRFIAQIRRLHSPKCSGDVKIFDMKQKMPAEKIKKIMGMENVGKMANVLI